MKSSKIAHIPLLDLYGQYKKIKQEIDKEIEEVIQSTIFLKGGKITEFENNLASYLNVKHVISCGNGTDALQIALTALDLKEGDEIITTPFTFVSTLEVIVLLKLKPVLVDVDYENFNINPKLVKQAITPRTRAIIPVHLYGQCANMEVLNEIAKRTGLYIIEDACQSLGSDYLFSDGEKKKSGTIGTIGCCSFFPTKNLGAFGDGGAIFTDNKDLAKKIRSVANHGMTKPYYYDQIGVNSRLDAIQAAILNVKLKYLDEQINTKQQIAEFYNEHINSDKIIQPQLMPFSTHSYHQYTLKVLQERDELQKFMNSKNISTGIYYPLPLHLQEAYTFLGYQKGDFPISEKLAEQVLSLPIHTELTKNQQEYITQSVNEFFNR